jgi:hypothetical protein
MNYYCKLFIDSKMERDAVVGSIASIVKGSIERYSVSCEVAEIDVRSNEEWDIMRVQDANEFLFYRFYADIEPVVGADFEDYLRLVTSIVRELQASGCAAVPACDFEDSIHAKL